MSIAKPFSFQANTYAKANEVNADFDVLYSQVNTNISSIAENASDIDALNRDKANVNGNSTKTFAVANPVNNADAVNKGTMVKSISNTIDFISGYIITKDSGSPDDTIIVSAGSCYDSGKTIVLAKDTSSTDQNTNISANTTYYVYVEGTDTGSSVKVLVSTSSPVPPLDAGYTKYRQIGYYTTDSSGHIRKIYSYGTEPNSVNVDVPDYTAGTDLRGYNSTTPFIAPTKGFIIGELVAGLARNNYLYVNGVQVGRCYYGWNQAIGIAIPLTVLVGAGDEVYPTYSVANWDSLQFYPIGGN